MGVWGWPIQLCPTLRDSMGCSLPGSSVHGGGGFSGQLYKSIVLPSKEIPGLISFRMDWLDLLAVQGTSQESSPTPQFKSINSSALSLLHPSPHIPEGFSVNTRGKAGQMCTSQQPDEFGGHDRAVSYLARIPAPWGAGRERGQLPYPTGHMKRTSQHGGPEHRLGPITTEPS